MIPIHLPANERAGGGLVRQYSGDRLHGRLDDLEWMPAGNADVVAILSGRRKPFSSKDVNALSGSSTLDLQAVISIGQLDPQNVASLGLVHSSTGRKSP